MCLTGQFMQGTCSEARLAEEDVGSKVAQCWSLPWQKKDFLSLYHQTRQESRGHKRGVWINLFKIWSQLLDSSIWESVSDKWSSFVDILECPVTSGETHVPPVGVLSLCQCCPNWGEGKRVSGFLKDWWKKRLLPLSERFPFFKWGSITPFR